MRISQNILKVKLCENIRPEESSGLTYNKKNNNWSVVQKTIVSYNLLWTQNLSG